MENITIKMGNVIIRQEEPNDFNQILKLTYEAFQALDYPGRRRVDEHYLVHLLKDSPHVIKPLSFVAVYDDEIIGHIMYTDSHIIRPDGAKVPTITFGPLSVLLKYHKKGIGRALVEHSMDRARELDYGAVLITGVPEYYPKLGFKRARNYKLTLSDGSADDAFMAYELISGYLDGGGVLYFDAMDTFEKAESDNEEFDIFHKNFLTTI